MEAMVTILVIGIELEIVEPRMEKVILDAAKEQGIKLELVPSAETGMLELEAA